MRIFAISGSLRTASLHTALIDALRRVAPVDASVDIYDGLRALPAFDPDIEESGVLPPPIQDLRSRVARADAIVISSPEYAHGVPGSLKNALDWLVGSLEFPGKPVALLGAEGRAAFATAQLEEILTTMSARLVRDACVRLPLARGTDNASAIVGDPKRAESLRAALTVLLHATTS